MVQPAAHISVPIHVPTAPLSIWLPAKAPGKQLMAKYLGVCTHVRDPDGIPGSLSSFTQAWLLWPLSMNY